VDKKSQSHSMDPRYAGEVVARHFNKDGHATVWQLTWKENTAFRRDADTLEELDQVHYDGEGWGVCSTGEQLVMSDGSGTLTFRTRKASPPRAAWTSRAAASPPPCSTSSTAGETRSGPTSGRAMRSTASTRLLGRSLGSWI